MVVEIQDESEVQLIIDRLAEGGKVIRRFTKMSFGPTIADVKDKFGIKWNIVICYPPPLSGDVPLSGFQALPIMEK